MAPVFTAQTIVQRAFFSSHWIPITSPTLSSFSTPLSSAPSELMFCARACCEKARPSALIPQMRTGRSTVRRGSLGCSAMGKFSRAGIADALMPMIPPWAVSTILHSKDRRYTSGSSLLNLPGSGFHFGQLSITDDANLLLLQKILEFGRSQQVPLPVPRFNQAGVDGAQIGIGVARVADQLPCPLGKTAQRLAQQRGIQS